MDADSERRLEGYFDGIGELLGRNHRREPFAMYAMGRLRESGRKSMEQIAARATGDPEHAGAGHQRIHHFISNPSWDDHEVRLAAARYAIAALGEREPGGAWIIDDTGFLKQGKHSVG